MRQVLKLAGFLAAAVMLFFAVSALALYHLARAGEFRRYLIATIEDRTGLKFQLGEADLEMGAVLGLSFRDVAVAETDLAAPALTAQRVTARVAFWPLLRRQLVFYEVRLREPVVRLMRDGDGRTVFLERLLNLPFLKAENAEYTLDLRSIKISGGSLEFTDAQFGPPVVTRFRDVALELESARAGALKQALRQWAGSKDDTPEGAALRVQVAAVVERDPAQIHWRARGQMVFPQHAFDLSRAWYDIDTRTEGSAAALAKFYGAPIPGVRSLGGTARSRLRLRGRPAQTMHMEGSAEFERLALDAPELFAGRLDAGSGRMQIEAELQPQLWKLTRVDYRSEDLVFQISGQVAQVNEADPRLALKINAEPIRVPVLKKYIPARWLGSAPVDAVIAALTAGELHVRNAGVNGALSDLRAGSSVDGSRLFWLEGEIRDGAATIPGGYPPLNGLTAGFNFDKDHVTFYNLNATLGQTRISQAHGRYSLRASAAAFDLRARGETELGELHDLARRGLLLPELNKALSAFQILAGPSTFEIALARRADGSQYVEGVLALEKTRLHWDPYLLTDLHGTLIFTPAEIKTEKLTGLLHGSPIELQGAVRHYGAPEAHFDVLVESGGMRAGIISSLLLGQGTIEDPGIVRGSIRYRGPMDAKQKRELTGSVELENVQLRIPPLKQPLRQIAGKISLDENGVNFYGLKGLLAGMQASASGRWRYEQKPQLSFDFFSPDLDLDYLMSQIDPESTAFYETLCAEGEVRLGKGRLDTFEFSDLRTKVFLDRRTWRFPNLTLRSGSGSVSGPLTIAHKPDTVGIVAAPVLENVPMPALLRWFEITQSEITGTVDMAGRFDTSGGDAAERKRNLNGAFSLKIADGTIHRMRVLVQLLNVLDLSRWFTFQLPDFSKQGIRFRAITGDFKVQQGVYFTENLLVDSDDLRMTGTGKIDVGRDELDLLVAARPFAGMDTAIHYIPLIGRSIAAVKNSFLVASFNIKGRIDDPTITPAPLGTLSEWVIGVLRIPKSLIPFAGMEKDTDKHRPEETSDALQP